jgi:hypothetical protein
MKIIFHNVGSFKFLYDTYTDIVFNIEKFSHKKYSVKILKIQDKILSRQSNPIIIEESKSVFRTKKQIIKKLMQIENRIDYSFIRCIFENDKFEKKGLINVIIPNDTKNIKKRKIKIEKFFYSCFSELDQRIAVKKIENILKVSMYDPRYTLCKNIMKRYFKNT